MRHSVKRIENHSVAQGYTNNQAPVMAWAKQNYDNTTPYNQNRGLRINIPTINFGCCTARDRTTQTEIGEVQSPPEEVVKVTIAGEPMSYLNYKPHTTDRVSLEPQRSYRKIPIKKLEEQLLSSRPKLQKPKILRQGVIFQVGYQKEVHSDRLKQLTRKYYEQIPKDAVIQNPENKSDKKLMLQSKIVPKLEGLITPVQLLASSSVRGIESSRLTNIIEPVSVFSSGNSQSRKLPPGLKNSSDKKCLNTMISTTDILE